MVAAAFQSLPYVVWYAFAAWVLALHVSHGLQSAVRTLGMAHPKYTPLASWAGRLFALAVGVGYSAIPIWMYCTRS
jgi:succinate dehydrogenase / fumarate reductase cytochrome b subunit